MPIFYEIAERIPEKEGRYLCKAVFDHSIEYDFLWFVGERWWANDGNELINTDLTHRVSAWTDDYRDAEDANAR